MAMRGKVVALVLTVAAVAASAAELFGSFSTAFTLGPSFSARNSLALRFSLSGWEVQSFSTWQNLTLTQQAFSVSGDLGNLGLRAGVVLVPASPMRLGSWTAQDFQVVASFVSFELTLGQIRFTLTIRAGGAGP